MVVYLDDSLGISDNYSLALSWSDEVRADLSSAGLLPNHDKAKLEWLGFVLNLVQGVLKETKRK